MCKFQRVKIIKFFVFNVVFLLMLAPSLVIGKENELHTMIKECEASFNEENFSKLIKDPKLALEADDNGFLPIDLLVFKIKKLGNTENIKSFATTELTTAAAPIKELTTVANALVNALIELSEKTVNQLHTNGIKVKQAGNTTKPEGYNLSPLGFLLSPINVEGYTLGKDRTLQANNQSKRDKKGLSNFEQQVFRRLWTNETIKESINWKEVISVDASDSDKGVIIQSTPLHTAAKSNDVILVGAILGEATSEEDKSKYINALDEEGYTPLMRALYRGRHGVPQTGSTNKPHGEVFRKLLEYNEIQLNERCKALANQTPLEVACLCGFTNEVMTLLNKGAKLGVSGNSSGNNIFHIAANSEKSRSLMSVLMSKDTAKYPDIANFDKATAINQLNVDGDTPLGCLLKSGYANKSACKAFLDYGADLTFINNKGQTLVHLLFNDLFLSKSEAALKFAKEIFTLFKEHAASKNIDFVSLLNKKDAEGKTVIDLLAGKQNAADLLKMVKESGGKAASELPAPEKQTTGEKLTGEQNQTAPVNGGGAPVKDSTKAEPLQGHQLGEKQNQTPPISTPVTSVEQSKEKTKSSQGTQQDPKLSEKREGTDQKAPQAPKKGDKSLSTSENNTSNPANSIWSNRLVQGGVATAAVLSLFLIGRKFFNKEKKEESALVDYRGGESVF